MDRSKRNLLIGGVSIGALTVAGLLPALCARRQSPEGSMTAENDPPKRPPGQAKPLLDEDIAPVLARLEAWYTAHLPPERYKFNPPATESELDQFEQLVGIRLPSQYRQLYRWHDGDHFKAGMEDTWGHIYGHPLLPLSEAADQWQAWNHVLADAFEGNRYELRASSWPVGAVDPAYINPRWIPLTHDGSGNHIGLDFDPWPSGRIGQVIIYGRDEDVKVVLAESLGKFLEWIADLLEGGNFRLDDDGAQRLRLFRLKNPPTDDFHEGVRKLLGATSRFL